MQCNLDETRWQDPQTVEGGGKLWHFLQWLCGHNLCHLYTEFTIEAAAAPLFTPGTRLSEGRQTLLLSCSLLLLQTTSASPLPRSISHRPSWFHNKSSLPLLSCSFPVCLWQPKPSPVPHPAHSADKYKQIWSNLWILRYFILKFPPPLSDFLSNWWGMLMDSTKNRADAETTNSWRKRRCMPLCDWCERHRWLT